MDHKRIYIERKKSIATIVRDVLREEDEYEEDDDFRRRMSILEQRFSLDESNSSIPEQTVEQDDATQIGGTCKMQELPNEGNSRNGSSKHIDTPITVGGNDSDPSALTSEHKVSEGTSSTSLQGTAQQQDLQVIM